MLDGVVVMTTLDYNAMFMNIILKLLLIFDIIKHIDQCNF